MLSVPATRNSHDFLDMSDGPRQSPYKCSMVFISKRKENKNRDIYQRCKKRIKSVMNERKTSVVLTALIWKSNALHIVCRSQWMKDRAVMVRCISTVILNVFQQALSFLSLSLPKQKGYCKQYNVAKKTTTMILMISKSSTKLLKGSEDQIGFLNLLESCGAKSIPGSKKRLRTP